MQKENTMADEKQKTNETQKQEKYVYVKDADNNVYVCKLSDLKKADELSEEEKDLCMKPPGDA